MKEEGRSRTRQDAVLFIVFYIVTITFVFPLNFPQHSYANAKLLPVILLHGAFEDARVWDTWEKLLKRDGIAFFTITFTNDDKCGSAASHAIELQQIVQNVLNATGSERVNIVAHSKGGLDARAYLAKGENKVENLIMIGTPNAGSTLSLLNNFCAPAVWDLKPGATVDEAPRNLHTKYYTISGDWLPSIGGNYYIPGPDDGLVSISSVESKNYFESLGRTHNNHMGLLGPQEYNLARDKLMSK